MRQRENRRVYARKFQNEITRAMHAGQERWVWGGRHLQCWEVPALYLGYLYIDLWQQHQRLSTGEASRTLTSYNDGRSIAGRAASCGWWRRLNRVNAGITTTSVLWLYQTDTDTDQPATTTITWHIWYLLPAACYYYYYKCLVTLSDRRRPTSHDYNHLTYMTSAAAAATATTTTTTTTTTSIFWLYQTDRQPRLQSPDIYDICCWCWCCCCCYYYY